ncbi:2-dehydro-3-deoxy-D-gluconate 5-dehydrogenase KduD [Stagnihabitans tardus]|uniref:2-dehydro-3-deoxy-D-gluconate 5-dehydrogenase KduD n=1 Tax=Stagnihabitans tardus TaxID=2699202 RepID=A0AAE4Y7B3_9RHOB|nr:2-dehydro-3-deoxy-D-gluconate 5-dehydrogenase KduD [Stagnihabitans tardus]
MRLFDLTGKVALVTGARSGIGQAMALALAEAGADVVGLGSRAMPETEAAIRALGRRFAALTCDLGGDYDAGAVIAQAQAAFGRLDVLVNNAGIIRRHDLADHPLSDWEEVLAVNLTAPFRLSQAAAKVMQDGGRIVMTASLLSMQGGIRVPAYTAAKHGVAGLTKALANELAPRGITVNAIAPGYIETDNTTALRADPDRNAAILARIPLGRWGRAEDLGGAVVFLASAAGAYVTGTVLTVDGGWMGR